MLMEKAQITTRVHHENMNAGLCIATAADMLCMKSKTVAGFGSITSAPDSLLYALTSVCGMNHCWAATNRCVCLRFLGGDHGSAGAEVSGSQ